MGGQPPAPGAPSSLGAPAPYPSQPPQPYYPPPAAPKKGTSCWIIGLILLGLSVPVLGVLSALAIYGVRRYIAASKTAEAKAGVISIARASQAAYEQRATELGDKSSRALCRSAEPVPSQVPSGKKYQSASTDWTGDAETGWKCLKFSVSVSQYYQLRYAQGAGYRAVSPGVDGFEAAAVGDLDGDGNESVFAQSGRVDQGSLTLAPAIAIENEFE